MFLIRLKVCVGWGIMRNVQPLLLIMAWTSLSGQTLECPGWSSSPFRWLLGAFQFYFWFTTHLPFPHAPTDIVHYKYFNVFQPVGWNLGSPCFNLHFFIIGEVSHLFKCKWAIWFFSPSHSLLLVYVLCWVFYLDVGHFLILWKSFSERNRSFFCH